MGRKLTVALVAGLVLISGSAVAASAFTTATVTRDANINVVADDQGPISLADGNTGNVVTQASSGELTVDFTNPSGSSGINPDATYTLGNPSSPTSKYAFTVTNTDSQPHELTFSYSLSTSDPDTSVTNVAFDVYDSSGKSVGTASEGNSFTTGGTGSSSTLYVVVTVDSSNLGSGSDLSGTLTIEDKSA